VIASDDDRGDTQAHYLGNLFLHVVEAYLDHAVGAVRVTGIDNFEMFKDFYSQIEVISARFVSTYPHSAGPESRTGSIGRSEIKGGADHGNIGLPGSKVLDIADKRALGEGQSATKDIAQL
jgi:hypothetical protein